MSFRRFGRSPVASIGVQLTTGPARVVLLIGFVFVIRDDSTWHRHKFGRLYTNVCLTTESRELLVSVRHPKSCDVATSFQRCVKFVVSFIPIKHTLTAVCMFAAVIFSIAILAVLALRPMLWAEESDFPSDT